MKQPPTTTSPASITRWMNTCRFCGGPKAAKTDTCGDCEYLGLEEEMDRNRHACVPEAF